MNTAVTIVGGGLSGLLVAYRLAKRGIDFKLFEANSRLGGRIVSIPNLGDGVYDREGPAIDLGPSWFWPDQPRIAALIQELGASEYVYSQTGSGNAVMEYRDGKIVSGPGGASMAGSYRLTGGMYHLIDRLLESIPAHAIVTKGLVTQIAVRTNSMVTAVTVNEEPYLVDSQEAVLALPPRLAAQNMAFVPPLSREYADTLTSVPTWMAGHAKFVAVYQEPFWKNNGFSGDGFSQLGPLVEIHDASPRTGGPYSLFGFVGVPATQRKQVGAKLTNAAIEQLTRLFGEPASKPMSVHLKDWALDPLTAVELDHDSHGMHASSALDLTVIPSHKIVWAGSETSSVYNGYLEGALEAGERAAALVISRVENAGDD